MSFDTGSRSKSASNSERLLAQAKSILFGGLLVLCKDAQSYSSISVLLIALEFVQVLSFPLSDHHGLPWSNGDHWGLQPLSNFVQYFSLNTIDVRAGKTALTVTFVTAAIWVATLALLLFIAGYRHVNGAPDSKLTIRITRVMVSLSTGIFFLPVLAVLFRAASCDGVSAAWVSETDGCWTSAHIGVAAIAVGAIVIYAAIVFVFVLIFVDRNLLSTNLRAKVTGRLEVYLMIGKLILSFLVNAVPDHVSGGLLLFALAVFSLFWVMSFMTFMPMIRPWQNGIWIAMGSVMCWITACILLAKALHNRDVGLTVVFGAPVAGLAALFIVQARVSAIFHCDVAEIRSMYHLDLWARRKVLEAVSAAKLSGDDDTLASVAQYLDSKSSKKLLTKLSLEDETVAKQSLLNGKHDRESTCRITELKKTIVEVEVAYRQAVQHDSSSVFLHLFAAQFYRLVHKYHFAEMTMLHKAYSLSSAIDVQFFVYKRTKQLQESGADEQSLSDGGARREVGLSQLSSADRIAFERLSSDADSARLVFYKIQAELMSSLSESDPDLATLERLGHDLVNARRRVVSAYDAMMAVNNNSVKGYRSYAVFLEEIMHDSEQAQEFLTKARRIEDSYLQQKAWSMNDMAFGTRVDGLSQMDEHDAVMVLSGSIGRLGEILSANSKSSTMLGLQRVVLTGRYLASLVPAPLNNWILSELEAFASTGECNLMDTPMLMPVLTGAGALIPVVMHLKEHPPEHEGAPPQFMLVLKPVVTNSEIAMFDVKERGYQFLAGTSGFVERMGVDLTEVQAATGRGKIQIAKLFDVPAALELSSSDTSDRHFPCTIRGTTYQCELVGIAAETLEQCQPFHVLFVSVQKMRSDDARTGSSGDILRSKQDRTVSEAQLTANSEPDSRADVLCSDSGSPASSHRNKGMSGAVSSVASTVFRHVIRRFRGEITNSSTGSGSKSDLSGMERAVVLLVVALVAMCIAIVLALSTYADTLQAYGSLIDTQGTMIRSARQCVDAFRNAAAYNDGMKVFNPPSFSRLQVLEYIAEFDEKYHQLLTHLPYVAPEISHFKSRLASVAFKDVRPDGNIAISEHTEFEAAEMFLVKARMFALRPVETWSTKNMTDLRSFCDNIILRFTPALNASFVNVLGDVETKITEVSQISLATFLAAFFLLSVLLVAQFGAGVQHLARKNFSALAALALIPKDLVTKLKRSAEDLYVQSNAELDPDDMSIDGLQARTRSGGFDDSDQVRTQPSRHKKARTHHIITKESLQDNTGFALRKTAMLTLPLLLVIGWFVTVYFIQVSMTKIFFSNISNIFIVLQTSLSAIDVIQKSLDPSSVNMPMRANLIQVAGDKLDLMRDSIGMLLHGGNLQGWEVQPATSDPVLNRALNENACSILLHSGDHDYVQADYDTCVTAWNGAYAASFYSVVVKYCDIVQQVVNDIPMDNTTASMIYATTKMLPDLAAATKFENPIMRNISSEMVDALLMKLHSNVSYSISQFTTLSILFVALFGVFAFVAYIPMIRNAGRHVSATQAVLLMFTDQQLTEVSSLKSEVQAVLSSALSKHSRGRPAAKSSLLSRLFCCCCKRKNASAGLLRNGSASVEGDRRTSFNLSHLLGDGNESASASECQNTPVDSGKTKPFATVCKPHSNKVSPIDSDVILPGELQHGDDDNSSDSSSGEGLSPASDLRRHASMGNRSVQRGSLHGESSPQAALAPIQE